MFKLIQVIMKADSFHRMKVKPMRMFASVG